MSSVKPSEQNQPYVAGNTIEDRICLAIREGELRLAMEECAESLNSQFHEIHPTLQRQGVEFYTIMLQNPPIMQRPLLICHECLLIWSPVFNPFDPIPSDIGRCPNGCNEHKFRVRPARVGF